MSIKDASGQNILETCESQEVRVTEFFSAFALFLALHSIPAVPAIRSTIISRMGRTGYFFGYSVASTLALVWLFAAALSMDYIPLWEFHPWHAVVTFALAPLGGFLVIAGLLSANPLSVSIRTSGDCGAIVRITRHPVLWGFSIWALGHIVANGDLRSLLLFGGFALFALGAIPMVEKRAKRRLGARWQPLSMGTSILPLRASLNSKLPALDLPVVVAAAATIALAAWVLFGGGHALLFGVDPVAALR